MEYFPESACLHNARHVQRPERDPEDQRKGNMLKNKNDEILHDHNNDGIDREGFLKCVGVVDSTLPQTQENSEQEGKFLLNLGRK